MNIQFASVGDSADLLEIYRKYIDTPITFEYTLPTLEDFSRRIEEALQFYPCLICREENQVLGYAYAHPAGGACRFISGMRSYLSTWTPPVLLAVLAGGCMRYCWSFCGFRASVPPMAVSPCPMKRAIVSIWEWGFPW